jgi:hypothetical protein
MIHAQTMEQVVVVSEGSKKLYLTQEFLSLKPFNLSTGFILRVEFGLGHDTQSRVLDKIPQLFEKEMWKHFKNLLESGPPDFREIEVTFSKITPDSLNLMVLVKINGRLAREYYQYKRGINAALVWICNENGSTIPSTQLTINLLNGATAQERENLKKTVQ